jgi:hypothetical protein
MSTHRWEPSKVRIWSLQIGHHLSHAGYIADAAKRAGMGVRILCARKCSVKVADGFRMDRS